MQTSVIKCLVIGDPHYRTSHVIQSEEFNIKIVETAKQVAPDFIVVLGDVLHEHERIHVSPLTRATDFLHSLSEISKTYLLIGNHDRPNNSNFLTTEHPFNAMKHWSNIIVVDCGFVDSIKEQQFIFMPYVPAGRFQEALQIVYERTNQEVTFDHFLSQTTALFAHQEFCGAKMGAIISTKGDPWAVELPLVISGHIHDYDQLQDNIFYVGTPFQHAFGDRSDKSVSVFTFLADKSYQHERIDLAMRKLEIVYLDADQVDHYFPPLDKIIKLVIRGTTEQLNVLAKNSKIKEWKEQGFKIAFKPYKGDNKPKERLVNSQQINFNSYFLSRIEADNNADVSAVYHKIFDV